MKNCLFEHEIYLPFHLSDSAGIVFFGHVYAIAHEAYELFVQEKLNIKWDDWFDNPEWILPIRQSKADYFAPLTSGKKYLIRMSIPKITLSSMNLTFNFEKEEKIHCQVETIHVFCDRTTKAKIPIPNKVRESLQNFVSDFQSGYAVD